MVATLIQVALFEIGTALVGNLNKYQFYGLNYDDPAIGETLPWAVGFLFESVFVEDSAAAALPMIIFVPFT